MTKKKKVNNRFELKVHDVVATRKVGETIRNIVKDLRSHEGYALLKESQLLPLDLLFVMIKKDAGDADVKLARAEKTMLNYPVVAALEVLRLLATLGQLSRILDALDKLKETNH